MAATIGPVSPGSPAPGDPPRLTVRPRDARGRHHRTPSLHDAGSALRDACAAPLAQDESRGMVERGVHRGEPAAGVVIIDFCGRHFLSALRSLIDPFQLASGYRK